MVRSKCELCHTTSEKLTYCPACWKLVCERCYNTNARTCLICTNEQTVGKGANEEKSGKNVTSLEDKPEAKISERESLPQFVSFPVCKQCRLYVQNVTPCSACKKLVCEVCKTEPYGLCIDCHNEFLRDPSFLKRVEEKEIGERMAILEDASSDHEDFEEYLEGTVEGDIEDDIDPKDFDSEEDYEREVNFAEDKLLWEAKEEERLKDEIPMVEKFDEKSNHVDNSNKLLCQVCNRKVECLMLCPKCQRKFGEECYNLSAGTCTECNPRLIEVAALSNDSSHHELAGTCPLCGKPLVWRKAGLTNEMYRGCTNYPQCKYNERSYKFTPRPVHK